MYRAARCGLGEANLRFGEREFATAFATSCSSCGKTSQLALTDQIPLELGQRREDTEHHSTGCSRGVDLSSFSS